MKIFPFALGAALALAGCGEQPENAANDAANLAAANSMDMTAIPEDNDAVALDNGDAGMMPGVDTAVTDAWVGRWNGPEGLFLDIRQGEAPGSYALTLKDNLDSTERYVGTAENMAIGFTRAGRKETIRPGTGTETGFKWLAGKNECLIILLGKEGYCR